MRITTRRMAGGEPGHRFIEAIKRAAGDGWAKVSGPVWDDYDRFEVHRSANCIVSQTLLVGVRAQVAVGFLLPAERLQEGQSIAIDTRYGCGCWLFGPGIDPDDPVDVMTRAFDSEGVGPLLAGLVLPEIAERHNFQTINGWRELTKTYRANRFRYQVGRCGTSVSLIVELEAYR